MIKLNAKQLRSIDAHFITSAKEELTRKPVVLILDNIFDTYNIGGLFRLADALSVSKMYLCADTTTPPNNRIHKASCGTYKVVPWEYCKTSVEAINTFRHTYAGQQSTVFAIEQSPTSIPFNTVAPTLPFALVVGNETTGVSTETLAHCDRVVEIPMWGINKSLNVIVSAAIVSYHLLAS